MKNQESKFYKLKKMVCNLKQAPSAWKKRINDFLKAFGFNKSVSEHDVYVKKNANEGLIILCLYVDDLLITNKYEICISKFNGELMKDFVMTDLRLMTYFLGIEFYKPKKGMLMHQRRYVLGILNKF